MTKSTSNQTTDGVGSLSLKELAEAAQTMPWDKGPGDVPFSARHAFKQAITADHYLELLEALTDVLDRARHPDYDWPVYLARQVSAAILKATTKPPEQG